MEDATYKKVEVVGSSTKSIDDAIRNAISKAAETVHSLRWFEVTEVRGNIDKGTVAHWQATVKIGFRLDE